MGVGLGEGGVVAARATDDRAAGATAAGGEQVAVGAAVEPGRPRQAADQAIGAGTAVEVVAAAAGLDQVVLGPAVDRVVAVATGDADAADGGQGPSTRRLSLPGPRSAISQRAGPLLGQETWFATLGGRVQPRADRQALGGADAEGFGRFVVGDGEFVTAGATDDLQAGAAAGVGSSWT